MVFVDGTVVNVALPHIGASLDASLSGASRVRIRFTARATIKGFEVMRMFKKGQFRSWIEAVGGGSEAHFINRLFGLV